MIYMLSKLIHVFASLLTYFLLGYLIAALMTSNKSHEALAAIDYSVTRELIKVNQLFSFHCLDEWIGTNRKIFGDTGWSLFTNGNGFRQY